ncbi:MAG: hypothetical protein LDLANPLL_00912 [Turneriella sp.]|nr:hypothetical protein [Turneriella sp.]
MGLGRACVISCVFLTHCLALDRKILPAGCFPPRHTADTITVSYLLPKEGHRILGEITAQYDSGYEKPKILYRLKEEAAACGADGVLLGSFSRYENQWKWSDQATQDLVDTAGYRLTVTLYRYNDR